MTLLNSISKKVVIGYAVILTVAVMSTIIFSSKLMKINQLSDSFIEQSLPSLTLLAGANKDAYQLLIAAYGLYGYTVTQADYQELVANKGSQLSSQVSSLTKNKLLTLSFDLNVFIEQLDLFQQTMASEGVDWDLAREQLAELQRLADALKTDIEQAQITINSDADKGLNEASRNIDEVLNWLVVNIVIIVLITALALSFARKSIVKPVLSLSSQLDTMVANDDLTQDVAVNSNDEVKTATSSINHLLQVYRQVNNDIRQSMEVVMSSVALLNHGSETAQQQIVNLSASSDSLTFGVEQLESGIGDSAERSLLVSETALTGAEQVAKGAEQLTNTAQIIGDLSTDIETSSEMLLSLKHAGDRVGSVVKTIAEIAEQTNLLALNAAIEAARAGESGRGFAVVADEVRTLASRTHSSTYEINSILEEIVNSISTTVDSMEGNKQKVTAAVEAASESVTSLDEIKMTVMSLSEENQQLAQLGQANIAHASEMRTSIEQVTVAISGVQETSEESSDAASRLTGLAQSLNQTVTKFKT